jgi:hypothetical protein
MLLKGSKSRDLLTTCQFRLQTDITTTGQTDEQTPTDVDHSLPWNLSTIVRTKR